MDSMMTFIYTRPLQNPFVFHLKISPCQLPFSTNIINPPLEPSQEYFPSKPKKKKTRKTTPKYRFLYTVSLSMMDRSRARGDSDTNAAAFEAFLERWLVHQEHYLDELLSASQEDDLKDLITRVLSHYQQYYQEKSRVAQRNIFLVFSPTWFTSLERAFLWIAGFRPALTFQLVADSVDNLSEEQSQRMSRLIEETRMEERVLNDELAKIQESVAAPPLLGIARRRGRLINGEITEEAEVLQMLRSAMESVVASADLLRMTTAAKVVEILNPVQSVKFLVAATQLQLRIRTWGLQRDAERQENEVVLRW